MAKFIAYFGSNSNAPAQKLGDHLHSGISLTPFGKKTQTVFWSKGNYKKKEYKVKYKGNFKPELNFLEGKVDLIQVFSKNKLQQVWKVSYYVDDFQKALQGEKSFSKKFWKKYNKFIGKLYKNNDTISGGKGNDKLWGYAGNDKISGGNGNDILCGGIGNDKLIGGKGKDIFKLSKGKGYDLIQDFKNKQDKIFIGSMNKIKLKNKGKDVHIYKGKDLLAKVKGAKGDLSIKGKYIV